MTLTYIAVNGKMITLPMIISLYGKSTTYFVHLQFIFINLQLFIFFIVKSHNNGAQYKGGINLQGHMNGRGVYTFPDDSSIHAIWFQNRPISEITYQDPLGHVWLAETISDDVRI